jgi:hypothetical protein
MRLPTEDNFRVQVIRSLNITGVQRLSGHFARCIQPEF